MKLKEVLARLDKYGIKVCQESEEANGSRTVVLAGRLPSIPFGYNRMAYYTLNLAAGNDEIELEEREAIRRHMWHLTTDIFGDDAAELTESISIECADSHIQTIVPKE